MKEKIFVQGVTFFTSLEMHRKLKDLSDVRRVSLSELIREMIQRQLESNYETNEQDTN